MAPNSIATLGFALFLGTAASGAFAGPAPATAPPTTVAAVAPAATPTAPVAAKPPKKNWADEVVCKTEIPTGTRLGGKTTCLTRADWAQQSRDAGLALTLGPSTDMTRK